MKLMHHNKRAKELTFSLAQHVPLTKSNTPEEFSLNTSLAYKTLASKAHIKGLTTCQDFIRALLQVPGYNLGRLAEELQVSKASISRLQSGAIRQTNNKTFSKLLTLYCAVIYGNNIPQPNNNKEDNMHPTIIE